MATTPLVNGTNYSWNNVKLVLFGVPVIGITKIEYKAKQVKENNYGMGAEPVSRGIGNKEYEGSIELYVDEWKRIIDASPLRDPLEIPPFDIQVIYGGTRVLPNLDILQGVEFLENPFNVSQGDSKIMITIPLVIGGIKR
ncbi:MAG: hypothetical protein WD898_02855 [Candidatus Paceibacterota bacterium]